MKKKIIVLLSSSLTLCAVTLTTVLFAGNSETAIDADEYGIVLDGDNRVTEVTAGSAEKVVTTTHGGSVTFTYSNASVVENKHVGLANGGEIANTDPIMGSLSVTATFTGSIEVYGSGDGIVYTLVDELVTNNKLTYAKTWDYLKFVATSAVEIERMELKHSCETRFTGVEEDQKIYGFNSATNIGDNDRNNGNRGWGGKFWASMNFAKGQGGRFHFYSELGGTHQIEWSLNSSAGATMYVFLNGSRVDDLEITATGEWFTDEHPDGTIFARNYNLKQGWNELYYMAPNMDSNYFQVGSIVVKALNGRRFDPNEIDRTVENLHFEAEQGYYQFKNGSQRFFDNTKYSGGESLGAIEETGKGTGVTFKLPSQGAGTYDLTVNLGCGNNTNVKVYVDDFTDEWSDGCDTYTYTISGVSASASWNTMKTTDSVRVNLYEGWNRIRVEYDNSWIVLDCFDLVRVS